eukprot:5499114-Pleurochrysis_carterae.AAC.1
METETTIWQICCGHGMCGNCLRKLCSLSKNSDPDDLTVHDTADESEASESETEETCESDAANSDFFEDDEDKMPRYPSHDKCPFCRTKMAPWSRKT